MFSENQDLIKSITDLSEELQLQQKKVEELLKQYDALDVEDAKIRAAKNKKVQEI